MAYLQEIDAVKINLQIPFISHVLNIDLILQQQRMDVFYFYGLCIQTPSYCIFLCCKLGLMYGSVCHVSSVFSICQVLRCVVPEIIFMVPGIYS